MPKNLTLNSDFSNINTNSGLPLLSVIGLLCFISILLLISTFGENFSIVIGLFAIIPMTFIMLRYPRTWIYIYIALNTAFFYGRGEEVTGSEIAIAIFYLGSLAVWLFWHIIVKKEKLIRNIADLFVLIFFFFLICNSVVAVLNGVDIILWGREAANLFLMLIYFPIRKYFTEKKYLLRLLLLYCLVVIITAGLHFYTYSTAMNTNIVYAYQMAMGVRVNQTLFASAAIFGIIFALFHKKPIMIMLLIAFTTIAIAGLITSFSRTFWVFLIFQIFLLFFYLNRRQKIRLMIYTLITAIILTITAFSIFQERTKVILTLIEKRFLSSKKGVKDISLIARLDEYYVVLKGIEKYPMAGNGLSKKISFWNRLTTNTRTTTTIHNGYLFMAFRFGIPIAIIYFFPWFYYLYIAQRYSRKITDEFFRMLSLGSFMAIFLMLVSDLTMSQNIQREGSFVLAMSFAIIGIVSQNIKDDKIKLNKGSKSNA